METSISNHTETTLNANNIKITITEELKKAF
jgi:hypothetical protein